MPPPPPVGRTAAARRLAPGHHLYRGADGFWRCALPGDRFLRLRAPDAVVRRARRELHGLASAEVHVPERDRGLETFYRGLEERGLLAGAPAADVGALAARTVQVEGDNPIGWLVISLLEPHIKVVSGALERDALERVDLAVSCAGWLPDARWLQIDRWCVETGTAWHRCYVESTEVYVGPCFLPGRTASYADTRARRLAAAEVPDELRAFWAYLDGGQDLPPVPWAAPGGLALVAAVLVGDILAYLAGEPVPSEGFQLCVEVPGPRIGWHPVLPLPTPGTPPAARAGARNRRRPVTALVDARLGVITRVMREAPVPGVPRAFVDYTADLSATGQFAAWVADPVTGGAALDDDEQARAAAIGEAVERYCGNAVPDDLLTSSFAALRASGRAAVEPGELALYSAEQYEQPGFPFVPFARDLEVSWVPGRDLVSGEEVLVPAALVYLNYYRGRAGEPPVAFQAFAGIAAGASAEHAEQAALQELLERDATTIWWHSGASAAGIDVTGDRLLERVLAEGDAAGLRCTFLHVPSSSGVPVVGAFVQDAARALVGFGSACRATPAAAAAKALTEAVVTYTIGRELGEEDAHFWTEVRAGRLDRSPYRPFRPDRAYRHSFRADWRDLTVLDLNLQLYLDPAMQDGHLRRLREPDTEVPLSALLSVPGADARGVYLDRLAAQGLRAVAVDVTTADVAATGLRVVRVVVPGLYHNAPAAFPLLGGRRLYEEPAARGWVPHRLAEEDLVRHPLPFA